MKGFVFYIAHTCYLSVSLNRPEQNITFALQVVLHSPSPVKLPSTSTTPGESDGEAPVKRGRGRPRIHFKDPNTPKRRPGRPPSVRPPGTPPKSSPGTPGTPKKRGRPPKSSYIPQSPGSALSSPVKVLSEGVVGTTAISPGPKPPTPGPLTTHTSNGNVCENNGVSDLQATATEV